MERFYMDLNDWILEVIQTSRNPGLVFCVSPGGDPVVSYSPCSADHPDEDIRQRVLRLRQTELLSVLSTHSLTSSTRDLILSRNPWAPLYFSFTVALLVNTFHCFACAPIVS